MNHRTRTDWNFLWPTLYHSVVGRGKLSHSTKFVLKDVIRHIPGPGSDKHKTEGPRNGPLRCSNNILWFFLGWVMQLACFVYLKRCWLIDKEILQRYVDYVADISYKHSLLVFPEGTDFTENTKKGSDDFAMRNNLQVSLICWLEFLKVLYRDRFSEILIFRSTTTCFILELQGLLSWLTSYC